MYTKLLVTSLLLLYAQISNGLLRRCYQCRSRGDLGSCKDPFTFNATDVESEPGVSAVPCASGWCGKVIEGGGAYATDDYDQAIQRMCVQRGPDDNQDRCANTVYNYKKVYMCFCQGDLCNTGSYTSGNLLRFIMVAFLCSYIHSSMPLVHFS
ncbi:uncharacterized protein LOC101454373 [Ceratitis capitata]|uniref:uncharacterized protein LOC101454373 n=1 Tax=Ceratitis capitata TaxID=7213 RepID=UPI000329D100|nr:uncharacterized protein LOC101454373 [Ceratitis capitata]